MTQNLNILFGFTFCVHKNDKRQTFSDICSILLEEIDVRHYIENRRFFFSNCAIWLFFWKPSSVAPPTTPKQCQSMRYFWFPTILLLSRLSYFPRYSNFFTKNQDDATLTVGRHFVEMPTYSTTYLSNWPSICFKWWLFVKTEYGGWHLAIPINLYEKFQKFQFSCPTNSTSGYPLAFYSGFWLCNFLY